jgi:hypothetical protein
MSMQQFNGLSFVDIDARSSQLLVEVIIFVLCGILVSGEGTPSPYQA